MQNLVYFHQFVLKILGGNKILKLIKGHNSVINLLKSTQKLDYFHKFVLKTLSGNEFDNNQGP